MPINQDLFTDQIKTMPIVYPKYAHPDEVGINPAYVDIDHCEPPCQGRKYIWVLRGNLTVALGIKNSAVKHGNTNLLDIVDPTMHGYINPGNRAGHPSLAIPEGLYDGSVYYAGWLRTHVHHIEIFLSSGRFQNNGLDEKQREIIEAYLAHKLITAFGRQSIIFFDWSAEANEVEFPLFLTGKPFPPDKNRRTYTPTLIQLINGLLEPYPMAHQASYPYDMEISRLETTLCFQRVIAELETRGVISEINLSRLKNLALPKADCPEHHLPCFDDFWSLIQSAFDGCMSLVNYREIDVKIYREQIKQAMYLLINSGLPHVENRNLCFWTTKFARNEAVRFAFQAGCVTDGMAQEYLRKIFYGYPGFSESLFKMLHSDKPKYPLLSRVFTEAMLEVFVQTLTPSHLVHVFFQDSLSSNNFFWNVELPHARKAGACILLYKYDLLQGRWQNPVSIDHQDASSIFIRRRAVHPLDKFKENDQLMESGEMVWRKSFVDDDRQNPIRSWSAPKVITLGRMRTFFHKMQQYKRKEDPSNSISEPQEEKNESKSNHLHR